MTPETRTQTYLVAAHLGGLATLGYITAEALDWPDFVKGLMIGMLMIPLVVILLRGLRDEYVESLWRSGTTWAFVTVVVWFFSAPFLEGVIDGLMAHSNHQDWPVGALGTAAILAFFGGFHVRWLRDRF